MAEYSARYSSDAASATLARHAVVDFARLAGFCSQQLADIECGVGEALGNAVEHGHGAGGLLRVRCVYEGVTLAIVIDDRGGGFNPDAVPTPDAQYSVRGFGIFIMRSLMDRVEFTRGGRSIRLTKVKGEDCPALSGQNFSAHPSQGS